MKFPRDDKRLGAIVDREGYSYASIGATGYFVDVETPEEETLRKIQEAIDNGRPFTDAEWDLLLAEAEEDAKWENDTAAALEERWFI
jgi:hypothetical protein